MTLTKGDYTMPIQERKFKRGMYETYYGNAAFVSSSKAKSAYDVDMGERIPIEQVDYRKFLYVCKDRFGNK